MSAHHRVASLAILFLAALLCTPAVGAELVMGPSLQDLRKDSVVVVWETDVDSTGSVSYGPPGELGASAVSGSVTTHHEVTLTGLAPGLPHQYQIVVDGVPSGQPHDFLAGPDKDQPFTFAVFGDTRSDHLAHGNVMAAVTSHQGLSFAVNTGDLVADGEVEDQWINYFQIEKDLVASTPLYPVIGNHEEFEEEVPLYWRFFAPPMDATGTEEYYGFTQGNSRFLVLDHHVNFKEWFVCLVEGKVGDGCFTDDQLEWLQEELDLAVADDDIEHVFVFVHIGPYSSKEGRTGSGQMRDLLPELLSHKVEIVFSGHDHYFEHGIAGNGLPYIIAGGGGAPLYETTPDNDAVWPHQVITSISVHSYCIVSVDGPSVHIQCQDLEGTSLASFDIAPATPCATSADCEGGTPGPCPSGTWVCENAECQWYCTPTIACFEDAHCPAEPPKDATCPGDWSCGSDMYCHWQCGPMQECQTDEECQGRAPLNDCPGGAFACTDSVCEWVCPPPQDTTEPAEDVIQPSEDTAAPPTDTATPSPDVAHTGSDTTPAAEDDHAKDDGCSATPASRHSGGGLLLILLSTILLGTLHRRYRHAQPSPSLCAPHRHRGPRRRL